MAVWQGVCACFNQHAFHTMKQKQTNAELLHHLSRQQLSARWQCSTETIRRREKAGILRSRRLGGLVRYKLADIEHIEQQAEVAL